MVDNELSTPCMIQLSGSGGERIENVFATNERNTIDVLKVSDRTKEVTCVRYRAHRATDDDPVVAVNSGSCPSRVQLRLGKRRNKLKPSVRRPVVYIMIRRCGKRYD